mmetsp:Transcript_12991/g.29555  ORF Transcript_12991/g.29555 Transcript_12991/m.29555 type:complete len:222 (+) Transcript_12991:608-1273(+)
MSSRMVTDSAPCFWIWSQILQHLAQQPLPSGVAANLPHSTQKVTSTIFSSSCGFFSSSMIVFRYLSLLISICFCLSKRSRTMPSSSMATSSSLAALSSLSARFALAVLSHASTSSMERWSPNVFSMSGCLCGSAAASRDVCLARAPSVSSCLRLDALRARAPSSTGGFRFTHSTFAGALVLVMCRVTLKRFPSAAWSDGCRPMVHISLSPPESGPWMAWLS